MQDAKEEVRARLPIEDVVGEYVQLKRAGRNFKGLSPFNSEKTPSFFVSPDKQIWHDFSSNKGGDVFSFVMEMEGLDFREALELLARRAGVELSKFDSRRSGELAKKKRRYIEAHQLAAQYYQRSLLANKHALDYVTKERGFGRQTIQDFMIGYAPDTSDGLAAALKSKGFSPKELDEAGLTNRYGGDLFRGRIMIPLMDSQGQVIGFTGRTVDSSQPDAPKYFNTRQTIIYDKSRHVFGLSQAKEAIRTAGYAVITEGNLDVVSSHQGGIKSVVATAGTAMTAYHLKALSRLAPKIKLAFDSDRAGLAATERAISIAAQIDDLELTIVSMPDYASDPDELVRQDPAAWQSAIEESIPAVDWVISQYQQGCDLATASGKRQFTSATLGVVSTLSDPVEKDHYQQKIAELAGVSLNSIQQKTAGTSQKAERPLRQAKRPEEEVGSDQYAYQDALLAILCIEESGRSLLSDESVTWLVGNQRQAIGQHLRSVQGELKELPADLNEWSTYGKILLFMAEAHYASWSSQERTVEAARLLNQVKNEHLKRTQENLISQLRDAELSGDETLASDLRNRINQLIKEIARGR